MLDETIRVALDATSDSSRNLHLILQLIHNRMRITQPYPLIFPLTPIQCLARDNVNDGKAFNVSLPPRARTNDDNYGNLFITFRNALYRLSQGDRRNICIQPMLFVQVSIFAFFYFQTSISIHTDDNVAAHAAHRVHECT